VTAPEPGACATCQRRPARPGSPYCSALCRVLAALRRLGLLALVAALAGCAATVTVTARPPTSSPRPVTCAWYTPTSAGGDLVVLAVTGPACDSGDLIGWVATQTGVGWVSTRSVGGTEIALMRRGPDIVTIWQQPAPGRSSFTDQMAGYLADDFQAAGWQTPVP
jgi:hypothetical protein